VASNEISDISLSSRTHASVQILEHGGLASTVADEVSAITFEKRYSNIGKKGYPNP
jgi:hypothetical protein